MWRDSAAPDWRKLSIVVCMCVYSQQFTLNYFECNAISHYSAEELCRPSVVEETPAETYTLLQRQDQEEAKGFACAEIQSTFFIECGVWAHSKIMKTPEIERKIPVSSQTCRQWVSSGKYTHPSGTSTIAIPGETIVTGAEVGAITLDNGKLSCKGQTAKIGNSVVDDTIELVQTRVIVREITVKSVKKILEVEEDHLILPSHCSFDNLYCKTSLSTYIWTSPTNRCPLKVNKKLQMTRIGTTGYLVDEQEEVVLKKGSMVSSVAQCPIIEIYATEYQNLFLSPDDPVGFEGVTEVDMITFVDTKAAYSFFLSE